MHGETLARSALLVIVGFIVILVPQILFAQIPNGPDLVSQWNGLVQDCKLVKEIPQCMIKGKIIIQNQGNVTADDSTLGIFMSDDAVVQPEDTSLKEIAIRSLKPGKMRKVNVKIQLPSGVGSANKFVIGIVDTNNVVTEADETNNAAVFGPFPSGDEYFPFAEGSVWSYQGTITGNLEPSTSYINTVRITGQHMVEGVLTTVFSETNSSNSGTPMESYLLKDNIGISYYGGSGTSDFAPLFITPFYQLLFPVKIKSTIKQSRQGVDIGEDLDGDGINETADVTVKVSPAGFEDVSTTTGTFTDCLKIVSTMTLKVSLSAYPSRSVSIKITATEWYSSGIGAVKRSSQLQARIPGAKLIESLVVEELVGYAVDGQKKGRLHFLIAENTRTNSDPVIARIGSDGTNYLVAYECQYCSPPSYQGVILDAKGLKVASFTACEWWSPTYVQCSVQDVAFDGSNYLLQVISAYPSPVYGLRVSPIGTLVDASPGFQISSEGFPSAAVIAFGGQNYLGVWLVGVNGYTEYHLRGAMVTPTGEVGQEFLIRGGDSGKGPPSVAFDGVNYLVTWSETDGVGGPPNIFGTRITNDGIILDPYMLAISTAPSQELPPELTFDGTNYLAVWQNTNSVNMGIYGSRISPDGSLLDGPADLGGFAISGDQNLHQVKVAFDGENYFTVMSSGINSNEIVGIKVTPEGEVIYYPTSGPIIPLTPPCHGWCALSTPNIFSNHESVLITYTSNIEGITNIDGILIFP
jgi:hypothetical protein